MLVSEQKCSKNNCGKEPTVLILIFWMLVSELDKINRVPFVSEVLILIFLDVGF